MRCLMSCMACSSSLGVSVLLMDPLVGERESLSLLEQLLEAEQEDRPAHRAVAEGAGGLAPAGVAEHQDGAAVAGRQYELDLGAGPVGHPAFRRPPAHQPI